MFYATSGRGQVQCIKHIKQGCDRTQQEFWKDKVIYKFGNARKLLDKDHPDVRQRKKKVAAVEENKEDTEKTTFIWGLGKFLPDLPITEDETSLDIHIKWLQREHKKTDPDMEDVDRKMELTFPFCRKLVVKDKIGLQELLDQVPWLNSRHELLKEFERLEPDSTSKDLIELLTEGLQKYRKAISNLLRPKKKPEFLSDIEKSSRYF